MDLSKTHPSWPHTEEFKCPHCAGPISDNSGYQYCNPNTAPEKQICPHCGKEFKAWVEITWLYKVVT
jgi:hypothetical protein